MLAPSRFFDRLLELNGHSVLGARHSSLGDSGFYVDVDLSLLFIFAVSSLGVYGIILSG